MDSLIDRLLSVEDEAGAIIEKARAEVKDLEKQTAASIAAVHDEIVCGVDRKFAAFREEALVRHEEEAARQKEAARKTLEAAGHIPAELISRQAEKIVARFREI
ncbi:MAG TPA: hypothetical protein PLL36_07360 [Candidatus Hydrogenedentes bacterium]|jgi:hypothetical protein|nr:hypothetical protein [Candidatus Hydrogenedentota bacterium]HQN00873.1 hypothetical protein [Candidatus Hydrogenedentota bacterium]